MANPAVSEGVFVGVDSGGTRTNVEILLIDKDGSRRSSNYEVAASLSGALSPSLASIFRRGASGRCDGLRITVWD
jgi:hypothetical protein